MEHVLLRFYVHESHRLHWKPFWEWLLTEASKMGIAGGSAFRAMAGFGEHHTLHEDRFFELQGASTVAVEFIVTEGDATRLIERVSREKVRALYALIPARWGVVGAQPDK